MTSIDRQPAGEESRASLERAARRPPVDKSRASRERAARRPPLDKSRASRERAARLSRLTGASLIGLAITAFWTLRLLGVL